MSIWEAAPSREGLGGVQPLSIWVAAPSREGLGGSNPCPFGWPLQIVRVGGCNPCGKDVLAKNHRVQGLYFYHSVGGARGIGMHGASRLALPRLPRTCFLPLAKLGPLRAPRWRLSSPQRRLSVYLELEQPLYLWKRDMTPKGCVYLFFWYLGYSRSGFKA